MGSPLPPDPYVALSLPKDATTAAVKSAHRKLVLKWHPDKVSDPALKQAASDQFHLIQSAYEILVDEERRGRYDAEVRLAELRREALERRGSGGHRGGHDGRPAPAPYRDSYGGPRSTSYARDGERPAPTYEERRPGANSASYFDDAPKATGRKGHAEYEQPGRTSGRPTQDPKEKFRANVNSVREHIRAARREKERKAEKDTRRERDRKNAYADVESDEDDAEYERWARKMREADSARRAFHEHGRRYQQEAENGYFADERAQKMFSQGAGAQEYIQNSRGRPRPEADRRPSPVRVSSDKEKAYAKRPSERPPVVTRQTSSRPTTAGHDAEPPRRSTRDEPRPTFGDEAPRKPQFTTSKSSPDDIRMPFDKPRAQSLQHDADTLPKAYHMKRAETMPYQRTENIAPTNGPIPRSTDVDNGMPTPGATPEYSGPSPTKYTYGKQYADDNEHPTPDGYQPAPAQDNYRTEYRGPPPPPPPAAAAGSRPVYGRRMTSSPSPTRDTRDARDSREKPRAASGRYETTAPRPSLQQSRGSSTRHVYSYSRDPEPSDRRPSTARASPREPSGTLFGEIPAQAARQDVRPPPDATPRRSYATQPAAEESHYNTRDVRPGSSRAASGYAAGGYASKRGEKSGPGVGRSGSQPVYVR